MRLRGTCCGLFVFVLSACTAPSRPHEGGLAATAARTLFDVATTIEDQWQHLPLRGKTEYRIAVMAGRVGIRAIGRESASGLIRRVNIDPQMCPVIEWSWYVTKVQASADLRVKEREDVAASLFLLFGDPGFLFDPKPVPTLRYVWTNGSVPKEAIIDNPYCQVWCVAS